LDAPQLIILPFQIFLKLLIRRAMSKGGAINCYAFKLYIFKLGKKSSNLLPSSPDAKIEKLKA
ncbi:MAG TPA: hypothetical protein DEA78_09395, partial [Cyanobacteria bacterium UBA11159]|nr:hypothetical protein [Cyanobacteria bacterium UBA11159]